MNIEKTAYKFGVESQNKTSEMTTFSEAGALAALETFYYSFNNRDLNVLSSIWLNHAQVQLNNPVGGIIRGLEPIVKLYTNIFSSSAKVWVEFSDIVQFSSDTCVIFAGRERGEFRKDDTLIPLEIRTTRVFAYENGKWGQIHHHGSIDDAEILQVYQKAIRKQ